MIVSSLLIHINLIRMRLLLLLLVSMMPWHRHLLGRISIAHATCWMTLDVRRQRGTVTDVVA
jgi:hypothetical protein